MAMTLSETPPSKFAVVTHDLDEGTVTYTGTVADVGKNSFYVPSIGGWALPSGELVTVVEDKELGTYGDVIASNIKRRVYSIRPGGVLEMTHEAITWDVQSVYTHGEDTDGSAGGAPDGEYVDRLLIYGNYSVEITRGILQVVDLRTHEVRGTFAFGYRFPWASLTNDGRLIMFRSEDEGDQWDPWFPDTLVSYSLDSLDGNTDPLDFENPSQSNINLYNIAEIPEAAVLISGMFVTKDYVVVCYDLGMIGEGHEAAFDLYDVDTLAYVDTILVGDMPSDFSDLGGGDDGPPIGAN